MKDLKLDKENLLTLQESQLEQVIGAGPGIENSCNRKSCESNATSEVDV